MHRIRVAHGFFRIWVVLSVLWGVGTAIVTYQITESMQPHNLSSNEHPYDDLFPAYSHCWDYRTKDDKRVQRKDISDTVLLLVARCQVETDKKEAYLNGSLIGLLVPLGLLVAGLLIAWIVRGFRPKEVRDCHARNA